METKDLTPASKNGDAQKAESMSVLYKFEEFTTTYAPLTDDEKVTLELLLKREAFQNGGFKCVSFNGVWQPFYVFKYDGEEIIPIETVMKDGVIDRRKYSLTTRGFTNYKSFPKNTESEAPIL